MTEPRWINLGTTDDFPENSHRCLAINEMKVVVMNVDSTIYAVENRCPHAGLPLGDGERVGLTLTCPYHGYTFNIKTGKNIDAPDEEIPVRTYPVRTNAGRVSIQINHNTQDEA